MKYLWEIQGLAKQYAGRTVIAAPDLGFTPGRITALCGPNGAGKSTLLRIIALLEHPDQGRIFFQGKPLLSHGDWFAARRSITLVAQDPYAFPGSAFYNVAYGLRLRGRPEAEVRERASRALAAVGLEGLERRSARTLSGGELQRMAIARAMVCDPLLLVLDEPTAHVDAARVRDIEDLIEKLRREHNMTIVFATHGHDQACRIADTVLQVGGGQIRTGHDRIVPATLRRQDQRLIITMAGHGPPATLISLELAGDAIVIRLGNGLPACKVPAEDVARAKPLPGETVIVEPS